MKKSKTKKNNIFEIPGPRNPKYPNQNIETPKPCTVTVAPSETITGYQILKGVTQGDALSCILFVLCIEPLIRNIKHNPSIESIETPLLPIRIPKVYGYADDVTAVAKRTNAGVQAIFTE